MKRKLSSAKAVSLEDLMKSCGVLANEAGLTDERRVFFTAKVDPKAGWLSGWGAHLNEDLEIEIDAVLRDDEEPGPYANGRIGDPLRAIWSVLVWPSQDEDDDREVSTVVDIHNLPFAEALRIASAIIQTHKFRKGA